MRGASNASLTVPLYRWTSTSNVFLQLPVKTRGWFMRFAPCYYPSPIYDSFLGSLTYRLAVRIAVESYLISPFL